VYCIKSLREEGIEPTLFWYNPNIHPYSEYKARRDCLVKYAAEKKVELILEDAYGLDEFVCGINGDLINRCQNYCYPKRLRKVFEYAKANGYDTVSTTLLYSIYQQHDIIRDLMEHLAKEFSIKFLYRDFREGWKEGQDEARAAGLYMQKYCGCVFSEEESMLGREVAREMKKNGVSPTNQNVRKLIEKAKRTGEVNKTNLRTQIKQ
jgi:predicted adenine nucleotide alpha hydrolase (AANH) superfamily ATPase